jgi:ribonuclease BN (tRNA processing enzyme)
MQVKLLGTGSILTKYLNSCALVDRKIMLDCPNGCMKAIRRYDINPCNIDVCLITHFHADHFFDIPFMLLEQGLRNIREKELVIIGPKGLGERIENLFNLAYPEDWEKVYLQSKLKTIEISDEVKEYIFEDYIIKSYKVMHGDNDAYGYTIENNGRTVGFTGDSILCKSVEEIIQNSNTVFSDMSFEKSSKGHMGLNDIDFLYDKYGEHTRIIPTHMTDKVREIFSQQYFEAPNDGDEFFI